MAELDLTITTHVLVLTLVRRSGSLTEAIIVTFKVVKAIQTGLYIKQNDFFSCIRILHRQ